MRLVRAVLLIAGVLLASRASADRGAFTVEAGGAASVLSLQPPVGSGSRLSGTTAQANLGVRYALQNWLEVGAVGFWENPTTYFHDNTTVTTANGSFSGKLASRTAAWGAGVSGRLVLGTVWRVFGGAELGFASRSYSRLNLIDVSDPSAPRTFGLGLGSVTRAGLYVAPVVGVEWSAGDHLSFSLSAKPMVELTAGAPVGIVFPLTCAYSWY